MRLRNNPETNKSTVAMYEMCSKLCKYTRLMLSEGILLSLMLNLNIFHKLSWYFEHEFDCQNHEHGLSVVEHQLFCCKSKSFVYSYKNKYRKK